MPPPDVESHCIQNCLAGDAEAFAALIQQHQKMIHSMAFRMSGSMENAEDLAQETFLRAYRQLDSFRGESKFSTWLGQIANNLSLNWRTRENRRDDVYGEMVEGPAAGSIVDLSAALAKKIAAVVSEKGETLIAKTQSLEDCIARIKKALGGKKRPAVSVKIAEQHFGQYVIDPAAQTELSLMLQQCGFTAVDDLSTNKADIAITGQAFSEFGMQKGNLKSCRARIEIKARDVASGKILDVDRQTSVAVDLAEHVAAKTALQNAANELADRLIPKLVE